MTQPLIPARATHPGKILKRELDARQWTSEDIAQLMGCAHETVESIIQEKGQVTQEIAIALAEALGTSSDLWTNLDAKYKAHSELKAAKVYPA